VVLIDILPGVAIGVALSFVLLIHAIDHPHIAALGRSSDGSRFADLEDDPGATPIPGVLIQRFEAELIFANADLFQDDVLARVHAADPRPDTVVLDFEAVGQVDVNRRGGAPVGARHPRRARDPGDHRAREKQRARRAASRRDRRRPRRGQLRADYRPRPGGPRATPALSGAALLGADVTGVRHSRSSCSSSGGLRRLLRGGGCVAEELVEEPDLACAGDSLAARGHVELVVDRDRLGLDGVTR
jgi:MFS superfamily sulfate permease-like transporter